MQRILSPKLLELDILVDGHLTRSIVALSSDGGLVGSVSLIYRRRKSATFRELYVDPEFRRRGIGTALVQRCCELSREAGCESIGLLLARGNAAGEALYRKLGFVCGYQYEDDGRIFLRLLGMEKLE